MNFGLANSYDAYTYEELNSNDVEMVSGGSGFGFNMLQNAAVGIGSLTAGIALANAVGTGSIASIVGTTMLATAGSGIIAGAAIVGGIALAGYSAYSYFG